MKMSHCIRYPLIKYNLVYFLVSLCICMYILTLSSLHISNYKQLGVCKLASINSLSKLTLSFDTDKDFFTSNFDQNIKTRGLMQ